MKHARNPVIRYLSVAAVFCLVCVIYLGRLFYIQIVGREDTVEKTTTTRTVTVQAVRGEIYDRNGNALVKNRYNYDLTLSYAALSSVNPRRAADTYLQLFDALDACGERNAHVEKFFPFEGCYPYYSLSADASDPESLVSYRLRRVLGDLDLKADSSIRTIVNHYVNTYDLLAVDNDGSRRYDDDEIDLLIRLYYDFDANRFAANDYVFAADVSPALRTYVQELTGLVGVTFSVNVQRIYCYPGYASHILGTVGPIYAEEWEYYNSQGYQMNAIVGKDGCEAAFESYLRGTDGVMEIEEDAEGNILSVTVKKEPAAGSDVYLTIDIDLQIAAEDGLAENVAFVVGRSNEQISRGAGCAAGAAVALDPETFEILAIASYPTYDLSTYNTDYNRLAADPAAPLYNRALLGTYAPGSTFKLGMAVTGLMEGVITPTTTFSCLGEYPYGSRYGVGCSTYGSSHAGALNVTTAITVSCNSFFSELGELLGIETIESSMKRFGFGQATGVELPEKTGALSGPTYWAEHHIEDTGLGQTWRTSIGQSNTLATPLQLAAYAATVVNGGTRCSARLLDRVAAFGSDTPSYVPETTVLEKIDIPDSALAVVYRGMKDMITTHTTANRYLSGLPVTVGGKTGTAENSSGCENALFVCAAPYDDPEILVSVVLEQGYTGEYASLTASRILNAYYGKETP